MMTDRITVKVPLTPIVLERMGQLSDLKVNSPNTETTENWKFNYLSWTCHGYEKFKNKDSGLLTIERKNNSSDDGFDLIIHQKTVNTDGIVNVVDAIISCNNDTLSTPLHWEMKSRFTDVHGKIRPELTLIRKAYIEGDVIHFNSNKCKSTKKIKNRISSDWCLFDAVQRLPFENFPEIKFDTFEALYRFKPNQTLRFRDDFKQTIKGNIELKCFTQIGEGVLPYEFWVDENHKPLIVITFSRVYILKDKANQIISKVIDDFRQGRIAYE